MTTTLIGAVLTSHPKYGHCRVALVLDDNQYRISITRPTRDGSHGWKHGYGEFVASTPVPSEAEGRRLLGKLTPLAEG